MGYRTSYVKMFILKMGAAYTSQLLLFPTKVSARVTEISWLVGAMTGFSVYSVTNSGSLNGSQTKSSQRTAHEWRIE